MVSFTGEPPRGIARFAYDPSDDANTRRQKEAIFAVAGGCSAAGIAWGAMYWFAFGWTFTTFLPLAFTLIVGSALLVSHRTRNHLYAVYAQIFCIMYITAFIQWSIGGLNDSGFVMAWSFVGPITALAFFSLRKSSVFLGLYLLNLAITLIFDPTFRAHALPVSTTLSHVFFGMNLSVSMLVVFVFATYFAQSAEMQRLRAEQLQTSLDEEKARQLGPYLLQEKLGEGGMGVVYKARHALLRRPTAIKLLPVEKIGEESLVRFEREVQHTATLTHPNTVAIHDYGHSPEGIFYYAMEYLDGVDLDCLVRTRGPLPHERVVYILRQVCDALDEAHQGGLVHRDIKPANIMLCRMGNRADVVKVLDFGLVKELGVDSSVTHADAVSGTPDYLAPEAMSAPTEVGPPADLYAVGAVAFWLLTGHTLFTGATAMEILGQHLYATPPAPSEHVSGIPEALEALVMQCLEKDPARRPPSSAEMVRTLDRLSASLESPWTSERAHAWWDAFEEARGSRTPRPVSPSNATFTVDLRERVPQEGETLAPPGE